MTKLELLEKVGAPWAHTPWCGDCDVIDKRGYPVCTVWDKLGANCTEKAQAAMIAAAPEMYDALRQAYAELRRMYEIVSKRKLINEGLDIGCKGTIAKMERAFKKAEGE